MAYIYATKSNTLLSGTSDNDTIISYYWTGNNCKVYSNVTMRGGAGNDEIVNWSSYAIISGGDGDDNIVNYCVDNVSIDGGSGNDFIVVNPLGSQDPTPPVPEPLPTLLLATDDAQLAGSANSDSETYSSCALQKIMVIGGDGNDTIETGNGSDITIKAGAGDDIVSLSPYSSNVTVYGSAGKDSINVNSDYVYISGGNDNDKIIGNCYSSKLFGGNGNDLISIGNKWFNTISGGAGNDTINAGGSEHSVNGGAGDDRISLTGDHLTVMGGKGNDTIYGDSATSHLYQYSNGDNDDTIYSWSSKDSLSITGGNWSSVVSNNDVVFKVESGSITVKNAKGKKLNVYSDTNSTPTVAPAVTPQDVMKNFMGSLDTAPSASKEALDKAASVATGGYFTNINTAIDRMTLDCANATDADTFLREKCGIILGNKDIGAITGSDAGGSSVKTAQSIVDESNENLDSSFIGNSFTTTNGLKVYLAEFPDYYVDTNRKQHLNETSKIDFSSLQDDTKEYIWKAFKTWWADGALDLIAESYGDNYGFSSNSTATVKEMYFGFVNGDNSTALATTWTWGGYADAYKLAMTVNMRYYGNTKIGSKDGISSATPFYLDRTLAHEMTHAVMKANINYFADLPQFISEGMAELTHGIDDERTSTILNLAGNATALSNSLSLTPGTGVNNAYAGGYMFLRYLAKQGSEHYPNANSSGQVSESASVTESESENALTVTDNLMTVSKDFFGKSIALTDYASVKKVDATASARDIEITGNTLANSIKTGVGNDTIFANIGNDTLRGSTGNDVLCGEAGNDRIFGDAGDDILSGGTGNDTFTGGAGDDLFVYTSGNDFITDYNPDEDKIKLREGGIIGTSLSGSNVVLDFGMYGSITVKNAKDKKIIVIDDEGIETAIMTYTEGAAAKVTLGSDVAIGDASSRTTAIRIVGNALDNSILGGSAKDSLYGKDGNDYLAGGAGNDYLSGANGNDTLWGGVGNDTLAGGNGADVFIHTAGKDVISDYATGDVISLGAAISNAKVSGSNIVFTTTNGSLTVKNGKDKELALITSAGNGLTMTIGDVAKTTYTDANNAKYTLEAGIEVGDASVRKQAIYLVGNALDNSILGGSAKDSLYGKDGNDYLAGGAGNDYLSGSNGADTLWGGSGNDTLFGGKGNDLFIYTGGKDVIADYTTGDKVTLKGTGASYIGNITGVAVKNKNVTLTFSNDSKKTLTLNGVAGAKVNINGATRIFEDGVIYTSDKSKSTLVGGAADVYWFDEDSAQASDLSAITSVTAANDYSLGKSDAPNDLTKLTKDEFTLTFSEKN